MVDGTGCFCDPGILHLTQLTASEHRHITGWPEKTSRTLHNCNGAYTLCGEISFGTFVDQYVLLLNYKCQ